MTDTRIPDISAGGGGGGGVGRSFKFKVLCFWSGQAVMKWILYFMCIILYITFYLLFCFCVLSLYCCLPTYSMYCMSVHPWRGIPPLLFLPYFPYSSCECCTNRQTLWKKIVILGYIIKIALIWIVLMTGRLQVHEWVPRSVVTLQACSCSCPRGASRQPPVDWFMGQTFFHRSTVDAWKTSLNMKCIY